MEKPEYCIACKHCKFDKWNKFWPEFRCEVGGEMDVRSTQLRSCPDAFEPVHQHREGEPRSWR